MFIQFNDQKIFPCYRVDGGNEYVRSEEDLLTSANRDVFEIHFPPNEVSIGELEPYYINAADMTSVISITDDKGKKYHHFNYVLPLMLGYEKSNDDTEQHIVMKLGKLTETDVLIRELGGKHKVYSGTPLEIAIAKKHDEISKKCNEEIERGIDIGEEHYSLTLHDQTNIGAWLAFANAGLPVPYHADGKACRVYSAEEFKNLAYFAIYFITSKTTYCNMLIRMVECMETEDEVIAVSFGTTSLTGVFLEQYNHIMENLPIQIELPNENEDDNTNETSTSNPNTEETPLPEIDESSYTEESTDNTEDSSLTSEDDNGIVENTDDGSAE